MLDYTLYRIGQFIALSLPLNFAYKLAVFISDIRNIFSYKDRRAVRDNLRAIFPEKSVRQIRKIRISMSRNFAKYLVDFFRFSKLDAEFIQKNIKIENIQYFNEALQKKKGVIVLSAHIGNWELGGVAVALLGYPLWAVALPHKDKRVNDFFNSQRESKGMKVIPLGKAVRRCLNVLKDNEVLALVGDRDFSEKGGVVMDFFGKPSIFPEGPAAFALKSLAPIVPVFVVRNQDDSYTLKIEKAVEVNKPANDAGGPNPGPLRNNKEVVALIKKYKLIIEDYIRRYPDQWFIFRRFWTDTRK